MMKKLGTSVFLFVCGTGLGIALWLVAASLTPSLRVSVILLPFIKIIGWNGTKVLFMAAAGVAFLGGLILAVVNLVVGEKE